MASSPLLSSLHRFKLHSLSHFTRLPLFSAFSFSQARNMIERIPQREVSPNSLSSFRPAGVVDEVRIPEHVYTKSEKFKSNSKSFQWESEKEEGKGVKVSLTAAEFRRKLDMCSKAGDLMGAISLYDSVLKEGFIKLGQYHYNVLLYLCSSAAMGFIHPAKSGSRTGDSDDFDKDERGDERVDSSVPIRVSDDVRDYARSRGFEIYERMCLEGIPMTEASLTSVARLAMSMGNGELAFETVKQMKKLGISPRLRSYGPAIFAFCNSGNIEKAFAVERHMSKLGIAPEEPELEALLRASVKACKGDKVYYLLHRLRTNVRQVSPSCADIIETWFKSSTASRVGKRKWDKKMIKKAMESGGGGWHGMGWLGKGKWTVLRTHVNSDGVCKGCGEKLVTIDLDPIETENFAKSVASIAKKRERNSSFQEFQRWLDYYGPFEAVVDAANVGLFSQRHFSLNKVNAVVNAIRQKLPSNKWPLIIAHNKRLLGRKMGQPLNQKLIEKWKNADAMYPTPTGSNDDWYWMYAAIKCKCLIVTNDEMRDHLFQTLGNDFFPKWKERHQVHFSFRDGNFEFHMPPPCSVVIQESVTGHWHIPLLEEHDSGKERTWLCVTRGSSSMASQGSTSHKEGICNIIRRDSKVQASSSLQQQQQCQSSAKYVNNKKNNRSFSRQLPRACRFIDVIEAAEKISGYILDFQI